MMPAEIPPSIRLVLSLIERVPEVEQIILFGSRAVGDHDERSDFDIAISAPGLSKLDLARLRHEVAHAETLYKISVTPLETMPKKLATRVLSQGIIIYER